MSNDVRIVQDAGGNVHLQLLTCQTKEALIIPIMGLEIARTDFEKRKADPQTRLLTHAYQYSNPAPQVGSNAIYAVEHSPLARGISFSMTVNEGPPAFILTDNALIQVTPRPAGSLVTTNYGISDLDRIRTAGYTAPPPLAGDTWVGVLSTEAHRAFRSDINATIARGMADLSRISSSLPAKGPLRLPATPSLVPKDLPGWNGTLQRAAAALGLSTAVVDFADVPTTFSATNGPDVTIGAQIGSHGVWILNRKHRTFTLTALDCPALHRSNLSAKATVVHVPLVDPAIHAAFWDEAWILQGTTAHKFDVRARAALMQFSCIYAHPPQRTDYSVFIGQHEIRIIHHMRTLPNWKPRVREAQDAANHFQDAGFFLAIIVRQPVAQEVALQRARAFCDRWPAASRDSMPVDRVRTLGLRITAETVPFSPEELDPALTEWPLPSSSGGVNVQNPFATLATGGHLDGATGITWTPPLLHMDSDSVAPSLRTAATVTIQDSNSGSLVRLPPATIDPRTVDPFDLIRLWGDFDSSTTIAAPGNGINPSIALSPAESTYWRTTTCATPPSGLRLATFTDATVIIGADVVSTLATLPGNLSPLLRGAKRNTIMAPTPPRLPRQLHFHSDPVAGASLAPLRIDPSLSWAPRLLLDLARRFTAARRVPEIDPAHAFWTRYLQRCHGTDDAFVLRVISLSINSPTADTGSAAGTIVPSSCIDMQPDLVIGHTGNHFVSLRRTTQPTVPVHVSSGYVNGTVDSPAGRFEIVDGGQQPWARTDTDSHPFLEARKWCALMGLTNTWPALNCCSITAILCGLILTDKLPAPQSHLRAPSRCPPASAPAPPATVEPQVVAHVSKVPEALEPSHASPPAAQADALPTSDGHAVAPAPANATESIENNLSLSDSSALVAMIQPAADMAPRGHSLDRPPTAAVTESATDPADGPTPLLASHPPASTDVGVTVPPAQTPPVQTDTALPPDSANPTDATSLAPGSPRPSETALPSSLPATDAPPVASPDAEPPPPATSSTAEFIAGLDSPLRAEELRTLRDELTAGIAASAHSITNRRLDMIVRMAATTASWRTPTSRRSKNVAADILGIAAEASPPNKTLARIIEATIRLTAYNHDDARTCSAARHLWHRLVKTTRSPRSRVALYFNKVLKETSKSMDQGTLASAAAILRSWGEQALQYARPFADTDWQALLERFEANRLQTDRPGSTLNLPNTTLWRHRTQARTLDTSRLRYTFWNCNGFNKRFANGDVSKLIHTNQPDVLLLAEIKCNLATMHRPWEVRETFFALGYKTVAFHSAKTPSNHGVLVACTADVAVHAGIGCPAIL